MSLGFDWSFGLGEKLSSASKEAQDKLAELYDSYTKLLDTRKRAWKAIQGMPEGYEKQAAISEFNSIEGTLMNTVFPAVDTVFGMLGFQKPDSSLGFLPAAIAALPSAKLALIAGSISLIVAAISYTVSTTARYEALIKNPEIAKHDVTFMGEAGQAVKYGVLILALAVGASVLLPALRKK